jgi:hypothetical protein
MIRKCPGIDAGRESLPLKIDGVGVRVGALPLMGGGRNLAPEDDPRRPSLDRGQPAVPCRGADMT